MKFYQTSMTSLKKIMKALANADVTVSAELRDVAETGAITGLTPTSPLSSTAMALGQLGLLDRSEAGSNLSV